MSEVKINTRFNSEIIEQEEEHCALTPRDYVQQRMVSIIKLKEQGVKEALSKLGYLNPDEATELKDQLSHTKARLEEAEKVIKRVKFTLNNQVACKIDNPIDKVHAMLDDFLTNQNLNLIF